MKKSIINKILGMGLFVLLFYGTFLVAPYVVTSASYTTSNKVSGLFPIALFENGTPRIVKWSDYHENPSSYQNKLLTVTSQEKHKLKEFTFFLLTSAPNNTFNLTLYTDDYTFLAQYGIQNGIVQPLYFRYTGAFVIFYCLLVSCIGTPLIRWLWKRYRNSARDEENI